LIVQSSNKNRKGHFLSNTVIHITLIELFHVRKAALQDLLASYREKSDSERIQLLIYEEIKIRVDEYKHLTDKIVYQLCKLDGTRDGLVCEMRCDKITLCIYIEDFCVSSV
jgi:hypothetical protein